MPGSYPHVGLLPSKTCISGRLRLLRNAVTRKGNISSSGVTSSMNQHNQDPMMRHSARISVARIDWSDDGIWAEIVGLRSFPNTWEAGILPLCNEPQFSLVSSEFVVSGESCE